VARAARLPLYVVDVRDLLASFEIFDVATIDRARTLAGQLRES
jgi:hypothetical protein